jgi:hypothetical protein
LAFAAEAAAAAAAAAASAVAAALAAAAAAFAFSFAFLALASRSFFISKERIRMFVGSVVMTWRSEKGVFFVLGFFFFEETEG